MSSNLTSGTLVSGYRIDRLIGSGATGAVYLARDETLDRPVALKILAPEMARDERFRERFLRESRAAAGIEHASIIPIYAAGEADGLFYLAMRYVEGGDLGDLIEQRGRLEGEQVLVLLGQVAAALDAAHAAGLLHRDVKPGNILVDGTRAWLADFGLAKHASTVNSLSRDNSFAGTVDYIAPEQIQGGDVDSRADIYALGCVVFQALAGRAPFQRDNHLAVVFAHLREPPPSLSLLRPDLPESLDRVIERALAKNPDQRYPTGGELIQDAGDAIRGGEVVVATPEAGILRTFLICDVRGYTRYTQEYGDEAAAELASTFAELVRSVARSYEGRLIELRGDEALVTFESARQALRAALAIQQRVADEELPRGVGIGLNAGEAVPVGTGYRGGALNMAARLCSLAEPGQVLASEGVTHLARRVEGARYLSGRSERLKGIERPVPVIEVVPEQRGDALLRRLRRRARGRSLRRWAVAAVVLVAALAAAVVWRTGGDGGSRGTLHAINIFDAGTGDYQGAATQGAATFSAYAIGTTMWATGDGVLYKLDPASRETTRTVAVGSWNDLAAGSDGNLWATLSDRPVLARVDARFGSVDRLRLPANGLTGGDAIGKGVAYGDGSVWVGQAQQLLRIDPGDGHQQHPPIALPFEPQFLRFGDGGVYVATRYSGEILKVDPARGTIVWKTRLHPWISDLLPAAGTLWVTVDSDAGVHKLDERTGNELGLVHTGDGSDALSYDGKHLWVDNWRAATVTRIDPLGGSTRSFHMAGQPTGPLAVLHGSVWVPTQGASVNKGAMVTGKVVRVVQREDWTDAADPARQWDAKHWQLSYALDAKLFNYHDPDATHSGSELVPEISQGWPRITDHGRTYTFTIAPGYRFSPPSGQPVTAATMKFSIERALSGDFAPATYFLMEVVGEDAFLHKQTDHVSGIVADGNHLVIHLTRPVPDLLPILAMPFFGAVPDGTPAEGLDIQQTPIPSAGPYYVQASNTGWWRIVRRNPNYGGSRPQRLDAIVFQIGIDTGPAAKAVEQGTLDYASETYPDSGVFAPGGPISRRYGGDRKPGRPWYTSVPISAVRYLEFNTRRPLFADPRWRQAVNEAIDRPALAAVTGSLPTDHYVPPTLPGVDPDHVYPTATPTAADLARARALTGGRHATAVLSTCDRPDCTERARILQDNLAAIGIRLRVHQADNPYGYQGYDIADVMWGVDEFDPKNVLEFDLFSPDDPNFRDADWQARVEAADRLGVPQRFAAFARLELQLMQQAAPWAAYAQSADPAFYSVRLGCVHASPVYPGPDLAALCLND
jgi:ABC-type transport system substrate-binding protein/class 3 adenylate cyclase/tRNA A-37 threonylcarbamoyl transferase component Bud32